MSNVQAVLCLFILLVVTLSTSVFLYLSISQFIIQI